MAGRKRARCRACTLTRSWNSLPRIIAVLLEGTAPETGDLVEGVAILSVEENLGIFCLGMGGEKA